MDNQRRRGRAPSPALRDAILQAAIRGLAEQGGEGAATREIAAIAGTTERTLFKHFGTKAALRQAAIEEVSIEFMRLAAFARVHDPEPFTPGEFRRWHHDFLTERVGAARRAPDSYRIVFAELLGDPVFRDRYRRRWMTGVFQPLVGHLTALQRAGACDDRLGAGALGGVFFSLNLGMLLARFALAPDEPWDPDADIAAITDAFAACCGWPRL